MENVKDYTSEQWANLPLNDLTNIGLSIERAIFIRKERDKKEWTKKLVDLVQQSGFSLPELAGDMKSPKVSKDQTIKEPKPPKYRNPDNHEETWTGMGAKKKWLVAMLDNGRTLDEFLIK